MKEMIRIPDLPDISDLVQAREETSTLIQDMEREIGSNRIKVEKLNQEIVQRYKALGVKADYCDHPVVKYEGMGSNSCECCDKYLS